MSIHKSRKILLLYMRYNQQNSNYRIRTYGVAKVIIKKNVIKKLKNGKKYTVKITYLKDTIKTAVKAK